MSSIEGANLHLVLESTKTMSLLLASITFILNQYLQDRNRHAPTSRLIAYIISIVTTLGIILMFSYINICEVIKISNLGPLQGYYILLSGAPLIPSLCFFWILLRNLPNW